jgi:hypothetical protein
VSLTGLSTQLGDAIEEIVGDLGQAQRLSLAGLRRRLRRSTLKALGKIEQAWQESGT